MSITVEDIRREVKEKNVTFIRLMFSDILGTMKNVEIPATDEQLEKVLSNKAMFDGSSIEGFVRINESDMYLYPDLDSWTVFPWGDENGSVAGLICDVYTTCLLYTSSAQPAILEPMMLVTITVPEENLGDVMGHVTARRGRVDGMEAHGASQIVRAYVPLAEMFGYATVLRSATQGRGTFMMVFDHYEDVPKSVQEEIIKKAKGEA